MPVSFTHGASSDIGRRPAQQDSYHVEEKLFSSGPACALFGVWDGHGSDGGKASAFCKAAFPEVLAEYKDTLLDEPQAALKAVFAEVNSRLNENEKIDTYMSGTTVILALVVGEKVIVAHAGDSRGVLYQKVDGKLTAKQLTSDHNCINTVERERVESSGGRVEQLFTENGAEGPFRIFKGTLPYPGLVVTRTLGDQVASRLGVLCEPEVAVVDLGPTDQYLVLATDGVWDGLSLEEVSDILKNGPEADAASKAITAGSLAGMERLHLDDNTTNIVVRFKHEN